ncbi:MAG: thioredoxin domain-containing protein [Candidatus Limnocylindrales bacterium]
MPGANRLAAETSPYLLQHAHNPVDWQPWGPEALALAVAGDRPIFLSVGYAACHWCHVMERESFEDVETAAILNADFVAIKVDREERPDVDAVYMAALQTMTGGGGWPMSLFLTPDGRPFYGGTYYPGEPRYGMPSFRETLVAVATAWRDRRDELESRATELADEVRRASAALSESVAEQARRAPEPPGPAPRSPAGWDSGSSLGSLAPSPGRGGGVTAQTVARLVDEFDFEHGGWGGPPRFPQPATIELLLRAARTTPHERVLRTALRALDAMADGGIHDQIGGGFHRYATDSDWLVPHFEKMLYDNAQLARVYLHAYQLTRERRFGEVAETTLDYMARELRTPDGLFAASQDADTGGVEGATYVWTRDEVAATLGAGDDETGGSNSGGPAAVFASAYGVSEVGNWEGQTILSRVMNDQQVAALYGLAPEAVAESLAATRGLLFARRRERPQPALDDKALAAWNGLAIAAFAEAIPVLDRPGDRENAEAAAEAALHRLRGPDGRLARSFRAGRTSGSGGLDDYACLADGLVSLYEATFDERWLTAALELVDVVARQFADPAGGWYDAAADAESLIVRPKEVQDGATPSGGATAAAVMLRIFELTGENRLREDAERAIGGVERLAARYPRAFAAWLAALDFAGAPVAQVAVAGDPNAAETKALVAVARRGFQPHRVLAVGDPRSTTLELLSGRHAIGGRATAYVCRDFACRLPVTEPDDLARALVDRPPARNLRSEPTR